MTLSGSNHTGTREFGLYCPGCGAQSEPGPRWAGCATCRDAGGFPHWLEVRYDLEEIDPAPLRRAGRVWDYAALLPVRFPGDAPTLGEGNTPLVRIERLNRELGLPNLHLKLEAVNPTGAFKDRFHTVSLAVARELGFARALVTTAGNHGTSCAAYAARAGLPLLIITDPKSSPEQRRLMRLFGAHVTAPSMPGPVMPLARALMETLVREHGFYPSTVLGTFTGPANPYGVEGYKTIAFEVAAQLGRVPDRMCVPTSAGDALYGPYKGFRELRELGLIDRLPRMTACQAAGANFVVETLRRRQEGMASVVPDTFALSIGDPTGGQYALEAIRKTGGDAWDAPDADLLEAVALLGRHGVCAEGASAAPIAALRREAEAGAVDRDELIVAVLTGTGVKWPAQLDAALGPEPALLPDDAQAILTAFEATATDTARA
jgi:threonine synthase